MSPPIWTHDALRSSAAPYQGQGWRLVEAQHRVSTMKLVDSLAEQAVLEEILEGTKPALPPQCTGLDFLLATPFRYRPYPHGSRFRRAGFTPGVWYGAESVTTAVAEMVFYRFLFFAESPETPFPANPAEYTAFAARIAAPAMLDLGIAPFAQDLRLQNLTDYTACQDLAESARAVGVTLLRYPSLRDPGRGANLAVLDCAAFSGARPFAFQTWHIRLHPGGAMAMRDMPAGSPSGAGNSRLDFPKDSFAADPRLQDMVWARKPARARPRGGATTPQALGGTE